MGEVRVGLSFLTNLERLRCGRRLEADRVQTVCDIYGKPLLGRYGLDAARGALDRRMLAGGEASMWRYFELLPVRERRTSIPSQNAFC